MRMLPRSRVLTALLALTIAAGVPGTIWAGSDQPVEPPSCDARFAAAGAIAQAVGATGAAPADGVAGALLDLTIPGCAGRSAWLSVAGEHPELLGGSAASDVLAARCGMPGSSVAGASACPPARLVARPKVVPGVKGAQRTRTYPIVGLSPDELFTQMQLNGSAGCPTHALACANIQPRIQPLVTTGGTCRVIGVRASLAIEAVVPRWTGPARVPAELAAWWRKAAKRIGDHEARHVTIANQHLAKLRREIVGRSCSSLQAYVTKWSRQLTAAQDAFDRKDANRPWPVYEGPLP